jgi:hypothetical protein
MTFLTKSASTFDAGPIPDRGRRRRIPERRKLRAYATAAAARLRDLAPYAAMELILPGGSLMALLLWLYRRHGAAFLFRRGL